MHNHTNEIMAKFRVGVVGYSGQKFDEDQARRVLLDLFKEIKYTEGLNVEIVSGLTWMGIPGLAYEIATAFDWDTVGIAPTCAKEYERFPCDLVHWVGEDWGDESEAFLRSIDLLIRVGGGKQSMTETARAKELGIPVIERDLEVSVKVA